MSKMAEPRIAAALSELRKMAAQRRRFETGWRVRELLEQSPEHPQLLALLEALAADRAAFLTGLGQNPVVPCYGDPNQTYTLRLPAPFNPEEATPVLYVSAPNGGPHSPEWTVVRRAAGHLPWILVHVNNSRNRPWEDILRAQDEVLGDVRSRFRLHPTRQFATGFLGGSRASFMMAFRYPKQIRGVLGMGAGLPGLNEFPAPGLAACILIGSEDPNRGNDIPRSVGVLQNAGALNWLDRTVR